MRVHLISLALQYLKGKRSCRAAPWDGGAPFEDEADAIATLKQLTGQDFGCNPKVWGEWLRKNRAAYYWEKPPSQRRRHK